MVRTVTVIGAGDMGHGFVAHFALYDLDVTLVDHRQSNLDRARERIHDVVEFHREEGLADASPEAVLEGVETTLDREAGVADADLVLETVTEDLDVKREVFAAVGEAAPDDAVLSSNTSGIPITDIAEGFDFADRLVGCHWWYPPYLLEPVEVMRGERTSDETMRRMKAFVESVDRKPVVVERDVPGFVWNRVQNAVVRECVHIVEEGVASVEDVNTAIRDGYARRTSVIGPFETMDVAGLELFRTVAGELYPHLSDADEPSDLFDEYVERGRGGIEDGVGFFDYDEPPEAITRDRDEQLAALSRLFEERRE
jgi:3-hydroxyacyl-CoA dehydrogenase